MSFPLVDSSYDNEEIIRCMETLLSGELTMGNRVREFEAKFAEAVGAPHAVMVNSGSSANLLAMAAITNPGRRNRLHRGDRVAIPAVCWSTSLWPIVQMGLVPVLVDVDPETLNLSIPALERAIETAGVRAIQLVHVLGNPTEMGQVLDLATKHDLLLIEDTCESLGTTYGDRRLGTIGEFGTFSFYFSHHMTTIEGGMVLAKDQEDDDLLRCLRSHGWSREQSNRTDIEDRYPDIDPRFLFVNAGFNLRPMEIQAAFGLEQIKRLSTMNEHRRSNVARIRSAFTSHPRWRGQLKFPRPTTDSTPAWFGFPFLVDDSVDLDYRDFIGKLSAKGIDSRPIVSGNMALQPALKLFDVDLGQGPFVGAQQIHERGIFIGAHSKPIDDSRIDSLVTVILDSLGG